MTDPTPTPTPETAQPEKWSLHTPPAFKKVPHARYWAADHDTYTELGGLSCAWYESRRKDLPTFVTDDLTELFTEVAPHIPGMLQAKLDKELPPISAWVDPVSGQQARNPFAEPQDIASQVLLTKHDPRLAEHLKRLAKDGGAPSYAYLHEIHEAEAARQRARAIEYGPREHTAENNPFLDPHAITKQSALQTADPELVAYFKAEAAASPIRLPWSPSHGNMTLMAKLSVANPALGRLARKAGELLQQWTRDEFTVARAAEEQARAQRIAAEMRLKVPGPKR